MKRLTGVEFESSLNEVMDYFSFNIDLAPELKSVPFGAFREALAHGTSALEDNEIRDYAMFIEELRQLKEKMISAYKDSINGSAWWDKDYATADYLITILTKLKNLKNGIQNPLGQDINKLVNEVVEATNPVTNIKDEIKALAGRIVGGIVGFVKGFILTMSAFVFLSLFAVPFFPAAPLFAAIASVPIGIGAGIDLGKRFAQKGAELLSPNCAIDLDVKSDIQSKTGVLNRFRTFSQKIKYDSSDPDCVVELQEQLSPRPPVHENKEEKLQSSTFSDSDSDSDAPPSPALPVSPKTLQDTQDRYDAVRFRNREKLFKVCQGEPVSPLELVPYVPGKMGWS